MNESTNPLKRSVLYLGFWTLLGFSFAASNYFDNVLEGRPTQWQTYFLWNVPEYYLWMFLALGIIRLNKKFPLNRLTDFKTLILHLIFSVIFSLTHLSLLIVVSIILNQPKDTFFSAAEKIFSSVWLFRLHQGIITYWIILFVIRAFKYQRQYRNEQLKSSQLEAHLAEAKLDALRMQLHPHFLFNTLHSISALTEEDAVLARRMIARLGDFLRITLESSDVKETTLEKELDFLKRYLEIEQLRFRDRLTVEFDIESQLLQAEVPHLILQPIVENALRHGISPRNSPGTIKISAHRSDSQTLVLRVKDNGIGLKNDSPAKQGLGLKNTEARLEHCYEDNYRFLVESTGGKGVSVLIEIPLVADGKFVKAAGKL